MTARCGIGADRGASGWRSGGPFGLVNHEPRVGLTDTKRRAALELYAGLDVSVAETSVCVVDADGEVIRETKVPTEPEAIIAALAAAGVSWKRIGLEAGPLSQPAPPPSPRPGARCATRSAGQGSPPAR